MPAPPAFEDRAAIVGAPLAAHLGAQPGDGLLLRIGSGQDIPGESLYGRREDTSRTIRLTCSGIAGPERLGEFALRPGQGTVFSVFVPLARLQRELAQPGRANTILGREPVAGRRVRTTSTGAPRARRGVGCRRSFPARSSPGGEWRSRAARILLDDAIARAAFDAAGQAGRPASGVFAYLANAIRARGREIPYSVIAAADLGQGALGDVRFVAGSAMPPAPADAQPLDLAQRVGLAGSRGPDRRADRRRLLPLGGGLRPGHADRPVQPGWCRGDRRRRGRHAGAGRPRGHRRSKPAGLGPAVSAGPPPDSRRRTRTTGSAIGARRRPSSRCRPGRRSGRAGSAG